MKRITLLLIILLTLLCTGCSNRKNSIDVYIAITYNEYITLEDYDNKIKIYKEILEDRIDELDDFFNFDVYIMDGIGGWTFINDSELVLVEEPTFPIRITNYKKESDVRLFSSLLSDTTYDVQECFGIIKSNYKGDSLEISIPIIDINNELINTLKESELEGFTINNTNKELIIIDGDDNKVNLLIDLLNKRNLINKDKEIKRNKVNSDWLYINDRMDLYESWIKSNKRETNNPLYDYVLEAYYITEYVTDNQDNLNTRRVEDILNLINNQNASPTLNSDYSLFPIY